jgi:hypothetical protein
MLSCAFGFVFMIILYTGLNCLLKLIQSWKWKLLNESRTPLPKATTEIHGGSQQTPHTSSKLQPYCYLQHQHCKVFKSEFAPEALVRTYSTEMSSNIFEVYLLSRTVSASKNLQTAFLRGLSTHLQVAGMREQWQPIIPLSPMAASFPNQFTATSSLDLRHNETWIKSRPAGIFLLHQTKWFRKL